jgi:hypothetical protein
MSSGTNLTSQDMARMDALVDDLLEQVKSGDLDALAVRGIITHIMVALDRGNLAEARKWFEEGKKIVREPTYKS